MKASNDFSKQAIDAAIKIGAVALLIWWCFSILSPFIMLVVWGGIIAIALYPVAMSLHKRLGVSKGKASALISTVGVLLLLIPLIALSSGIYTSATEVVTGLQDGTLVVPKPQDNLKQIPFVGDQVYAAVNYASTNMEGFLVKYGEQVKGFLSQTASIVGSVSGGFVQFIISTMIAGAFMSNADVCQKGFTKLADRLTNKKGERLVNLSKSTVRSVVQGVIGVALIQSVMAGVGMVVVGVPAAALWMVAVILVAIVQLPPILALIPAIIYVFSVESALVAGLFLVWCILVSASDAVLKPVLLSRGSDTPMLVTLLGALGGMAMSGIVGLFVGAVVLSLTYQLMVNWLDEDTSDVNHGIERKEEIIDEEAS
ncbi:AI-2E family transporter [Vibrio alfacsensis]|uniref:AI-2E family transporter n=1 Tax=Vibrio alfacsensis TaxID=1074311 RepID=UPI001BEDEECE|nr:AI-2E family transporter [Vibrio alfacsensis]BCN26158.1 AI-2E family transporter [Vibrio alfacsensis]